MTATSFESHQLFAHVPEVFARIGRPEPGHELHQPAKDAEEHSRAPGGPGSGYKPLAARPGRGDGDAPPLQALEFP